MSKIVFRIAIGAALAGGLVMLPAGHGFTQSAAKTEAKKDAKAEPKTEPKADATKKPLTAQQLKMKACGAKWQEEKKAKGVKGREAWNKFRSACLKG